MVEFLGEAADHPASSERQISVAADTRPRNLTVGIQPSSDMAVASATEQLAFCVLLLPGTTACDGGVHIFN